jgi:hypothetical protein
MFNNGVFGRIFAQLSPEAQTILEFLALPRSGPDRSPLSIGTYICYSRRNTPYLYILSFVLFLVYIVVYYTTEPGASFWY